MGMNEADHCYDVLLDYLLNHSEMKYDEVASEALSRLCKLADPQADEIRALDGEVERLEVVVDGLQIERDDYCNLYHSALQRVRRAKIEALEEVLGDERFPDAVAVNATIMLAKLKAEGDNQQTTTKGS